MTNRFIKKIDVEFTDGSKEEFEGYLILISENKDEMTWGIHLSEEANVERVLDFAYDVIHDLSSFKKHKKPHLTLIKG